MSSSWPPTPPPSDDDPWSAPDDGDDQDEGDATYDPARDGVPTEVRVIAPMALPLRLEPVERPEVGEGERAFATYLAGQGMPEKPIAVNSLPAPVVEALLESELFDEPRLLAATLHEEEGGLRGVLQALIPMEVLQRWAQQVEQDDDDEASEPWRASVPEVPSFEVETGDASADGEGNEEGEGEGEEVELIPFPLGVVLRFPEDRKYPGDLLHEAADLLISILGGTGQDASQKKIDNLLGGI